MAGATIVAALVMACPAAALAAAPCEQPEGASANVRDVVDARTLALADGRLIHLAALDVPDETAEIGRTFLRDATIGRAVGLHPAGEADRYGRLPAFVFLPAGGLEGFVQHAMVNLGFARVAASAGGRQCADGLLAAERQARAAKLGLWAEPIYAVQRAENPAAVQALRGRFALVEGRVLSVRESGGTVYVNFGRRWSEDFTVTVAKRHERALAAGGLDIRRLEGRAVRVRGVVEERGGPWIEVTRAEQVEVIGNEKRQ